MPAADVDLAPGACRIVRFGELGVHTVAQLAEQVAATDRSVLTITMA